MEQRETIEMKGEKGGESEDGHFGSRKNEEAKDD